MASGQHFKVLKGKKTEGVKKYDTDKYRTGYMNIDFSKKKDKNKK